MRQLAAFDIGHVWQHYYCKVVIRTPYAVGRLTECAKGSSLVLFSDWSKARLFFFFASPCGVTPPSLVMRYRGAPPSLHLQPWPAEAQADRGDPVILAHLYLSTVPPTPNFPFSLLLRQTISSNHHIYNQHVCIITLHTTTHPTIFTSQHNHQHDWT